MVMSVSGAKVKAAESGVVKEARERDLSLGFNGVLPAEETWRPEEDYDPLKLEYPALAGEIEKAREAGLSDGELREVMAGREVAARLELGQEETDRRLGRSKEGMARAAELNEGFRVRAMARAAGLDEGTVRERLASARLSGVSSAVVLDEEAYKKLEPELKRRAGVVQSAATRWKRELIENARSELIERKMAAEAAGGSLSEEDARRLDALDGERAELERFVSEGVLAKVAGAAASLWAQQAQGVAEVPAAAWAVLGAGALAASKVPVAGAMLPAVSGAAGLSAAGLSAEGVGAAAGAAASAGTVFGSMENTRRREAAATYEALEGVEMSAQERALVAQAVGVLNGVIEVGNADRVFRLAAPFAGAVVDGLRRFGGGAALFGVRGVADFVREHAAEYGKSVASETLEEFLQGAVSVFAEEVEKRRHGAPYLSADEAVVEVLRGTAEAGADIALGMLPGAVGNAALGAGFRAADRAVAAYRAPEAVRERAVRERVEREEEKAREARVAGEEGTAEGQDGAPRGERADDWVFVDAGAVREFAQGLAPQERAAFEEALGVAGQDVLETGEFLIRAGDYERTAEMLDTEKAERPRFEGLRDALDLSLRRGARGVSLNERMSRIEALRARGDDPVECDTPWGREAREIRAEMTRALREAGESAKVARVHADLYAHWRYQEAVAGSVDEQGRPVEHAKSPREYHNVEVVRGQRFEREEFSGADAGDAEDGQGLFQLIGPRGAQRLDEAEGGEARVGALSRAWDMEAAGADADEVWQATGWERGKDGKWRFEIRDAALREGARFEPDGKGGAYALLSDVVDAPEVFAAYPAFRFVSVVVRDFEGGVQGQADHMRGEIALSRRYLDGDMSLRPEALSVLVHEVQHLVQDEENFARGGNREVARGVLRKVPAQKAEVLQQFEELKQRGSGAVWQVVQMDEDARDAFATRRSINESIAWMRREYGAETKELEALWAQTWPAAYERLRGEMPEAGLPEEKDFRRKRRFGGVGYSDWGWYPAEAERRFVEVHYEVMCASEEYKAVAAKAARTARMFVNQMKAAELAEMRLEPLVGVVAQARKSKLMGEMTEQEREEYQTLSNQLAALEWLEEQPEFKVYEALEGEVEARNVQRRLGRSDEERARTRPEVTEDIARLWQVEVDEFGGVNWSEEERNSFGVPVSRVVKVDHMLSPEELRRALAALAGRTLRNELEGVSAQVNSEQRNKLSSGAASDKSRANGFGRGEHNAAAAQVEAMWRWAAEAVNAPDVKNGQSDVRVRRFVAALDVAGHGDVFAWLTVKESRGEAVAENGKKIPSRNLRIYSAELMDGEKLRDLVGNGVPDGTTTTLRRSFEEIIKKLGEPVKADGAQAFYQLGGVRGARRLDEAEGGEARVGALERAKAMEAAGAWSDEIWQATGWERGKDGKWRFEIRDAALREGARFEPDGKGGAYALLSDVVDAPEVFAAYPALEGYRVAVRQGLARGAAGSADVAAREIALGAEALEEDMSLRPEALSTLVHEVQHIVQDEEMFARGGNVGMSDRVRGAVVRAAERVVYDFEAESPEVYEYGRFRREWEVFEGKLTDDVVSYREWLNEGSSRLPGEVAARCDAIIARVRGAAFEKLRARFERGDVPEAGLYRYEDMFDGVARSSCPENDDVRTWTGYRPGIIAEFNRLVTRGLFSDAELEALSGTSGEGAVDRYVGERAVLPGREAILRVARELAARREAQLREAVPSDVMAGYEAALECLEEMREVAAQDDFGVYLALAGEVEARNVQRRLGLSEEERARLEPERTEDALYPRRSQIVYDGDGVYRPGEERRLFQRAFHGSPHRFERFSTEFVGTGEGAQMHGWGLYFAAKEAVARDYRETLADEERYFYVNGVPLADVLEERGPDRFGGTAEGADFDISDVAFLMDHVKDDWEGRSGRWIGAHKKAEIASLKRRFGYRRDLMECIEWLEAEVFPGLSLERDGMVFEVDVPDSFVLLDEQKAVREQPEAVRQAVGALMGDGETEVLSPRPWWELTGREVYDRLAGRLGSPRAASLALRERGVRGITYVGGEDGRAFVVFDGDDVEVLRRFYQKRRLEQEARGMVSFSGGRTILTLFSGADESTFVHEMGHMMLDDLVRYAHAAEPSPVMRGYFEEAARFLGIGDMDFGRMDEWGEVENARYEAAQELWARSFEVYLREGVAPVSSLEKVFAKMREWLISIYADVRELDAEVSPEVAALFDRLLAGSVSERRSVAAAAKEARVAARAVREAETAARGGESALFRAREAAAGLSDEDIPDWAPEWLVVGGTPELGSRKELRRAVMAEGGIRPGSVRSVLGSDEERFLRERDRGVFRRKGIAFEEAVSELRSKGFWVEDVQELYDRLMAFDRKAEGELSVAVSEESLPWLVYLMDEGELAGYLRSRVRAADRRVRELTERDDKGALRAEGPALWREAEFARGVLRELKAGLSESDDARFAGKVTEFEPENWWADFGSRSDSDDSAFVGKDVDLWFGAPEGEVVHKSVGTREAAERAAGLLSERELVSLKDADRAAWRRAARESRRAYAAGRRAGMEKQKAHVAALKERQKARAAEREELRAMVKELGKARADKAVIWGAHEEIERMLGEYTLKNPPEWKRRQAEELLRFLEDSPDARLEDFDKRDREYVRMLSTTTLGEMSIADVRDLFRRVQDVRAAGREEFAQWEAAKRERVDRVARECHAEARPEGRDATGVPKSGADVRKVYKGVGGEFERLKDWTFAATLTTQRLFDWIGEGHGRFKSAWTRYFVDDVNAARDEELRYVFARREAVEGAMKAAGVSWLDLSKARVVDGVAYTLDELLSVYAALQNERSRAAVLWGNFARAVGDPEGHAAHCVAALSEAERSVAEAVLRDYDESFDRLNERFVAAFNEGMVKEERYSPMRRLEYWSDMGVLDADDVSAFEGRKVEAGGRARLERGFAVRRIDVSNVNQKPIELGLLSLWNEQVTAQEHSAAFADLAGVLAGALRSEGPDGVSLARAVSLKYGQTAWQAVNGYVNMVIRNDQQIAQDVMNRVAGALGRNMAMVYLAGNLCTALKQVTSLPRFLVCAGPVSLLSATGRFLSDPRGFLSEVYELDPQVRERMPNAFFRIARLDPTKLSELGYAKQRTMDALMAPISFLDRAVAAIGWRAVFDRNVERGMTAGEAKREAQRAVALTQQVPNAKDMPAVWRQSGLARLAMIFTSDAAPQWGMSVYDMSEALRRGEVPAALATAAALVVGAVAMGLIVEGTPEGNGDEDWVKWFARVFAQSAVSSVPVAGKELMAAWEELAQGGGRGAEYSALVAPVVKAVSGVSRMRDADSWKRQENGMSKFERGAWDVTEGLSLLLGGLPVTAARRLRTAALGDDVWAAARSVMGLRRQKRFRLRMMR